MVLNVRVFAYGFPSLALVLGFLLLFTGFSQNNQAIVQAGWGFVAVGVILQIFYLISRTVR